MSEERELQNIPQQNAEIEQAQGVGDNAFDQDHHNHGQADIRQPVVLRTAGPLTTFDVFSFIVNKVVGTGIFTAPPMVLALTGDWRVAITLWAVAFLWSIVTYAQSFYLPMTCDN